MTTNIIKEFFDDGTVYDQILDRNYMFHDEIYADIEQLFSKRFDSRPFSLLDLGCGSAKHLAKTLSKGSLSYYEGCDLSDTAIAHARRNMASLGIPVVLDKGDLLEGLNSSTREFDVIFSSFALHHLSPTEKETFFKSASQHLAKGGLLLLVDVIRNPEEERAIYLDRYCSWLRSEWTSLSQEALDAVCGHIRSCDFPETVSRLFGMADQADLSSHWELNGFGWHRILCFEKSSRPYDSRSIESKSG